MSNWSTSTRRKSATVTVRNSSWCSRYIFRAWNERLNEKRVNPVYPIIVSKRLLRGYFRRTPFEFHDGESAGTIPYMAPEILKRRPYGESYLLIMWSGHATLSRGPLVWCQSQLVLVRIQRLPEVPLGSLTHEKSWSNETFECVASPILSLRPCFQP